jgi:hypothetical protein
MDVDRRAKPEGIRSWDDVSWKRQSEWASDWTILVSEMLDQPAMALKLTASASGVPTAGKLRMRSAPLVRRSPPTKARSQTAAQPLCCDDLGIRFTCCQRAQCNSTMVCLSHRAARIQMAAGSRSTYPVLDIRHSGFCGGKPVAPAVCETPRRNASWSSRSLPTGSATAQHPYYSHIYPASSTRNCFGSTSASHAS